MPIYEYQCQNCHQTVDLLQKVNDPPATECPGCHEQQLQRIVSAPSFQLKGSGWYVTDFRGSNKPQASSESSAPTETSDAKSKEAVKKDDPPTA